MLVCACAVAAAVISPLAPRASPLALRTLRDMAIIEEAAGAVTAAVKPVAEFGLRPPADLSALTKTLLQEVEGLETRMNAVESLTASEDGEGALSPLVATEPDNLKSLRKAATQLGRRRSAFQAAEVAGVSAF